MESQASSKLIVKHPGLEPEEIIVPIGASVSAGRVKSNDIVIADSKASRFHATFSVSSAGIVVSDLHSLNGTYVNDRRISTPENLSSEDLVRIGDTEIEVRLNAELDVQGTQSALQTQAAKLETVVVTLLLVDVSNYTKMSEGLPAEDIAAMLQRWFQEVSDVVSQFGGEVDKLIGDCVMALWRGSKSDAEAGAYNATRAAIEIQNLTESLSLDGNTWKHHDKYPWRCRATFNSGEALIGTIGEGKARDFTVLGDTVNVSFRLDSLASTLGKNYIFSETTAKLIQDDFQLESIGEHQIEGKTGSLKLFTLA